MSVRKSSAGPVEAPTQMQVRKRNGNLEPVDVNKIIRAVGRCCENLTNVDAIRVATKTISGLYNGATTRELDELSIRTAAELIAEEPEYSQLAARLLVEYVEKDITNQEIQSFSQSIKIGCDLGLINKRVFDFVQENKRKLNAAVDHDRNNLFEYFGIRTLYDRYFLKHPTTRKVIESAQYFWMRVACALSQTAAEAVDLYRLYSSLEYLSSTPTLFNAGTHHEQMSSCYLMAPPEDSIEGIYDLYKDMALCSKFAGGLGSPWSSVRSEGSLIKGTNGKSNGVIPWIKTQDSSVSAVNQGGKRKGAAALYLTTWHADIEAFLELRDNTGDPMRRTHNLNLANWIPDLFMKRVKEDGQFSLFDPKDTPYLTEAFGDQFETFYIAAEEQRIAKKVVKARDLYARMMKALAETGNGWMCFQDASNKKSNQTKLAGNTVHSSNLCTEILEVTRTTQSHAHGETAVCNLGSLNLAKYVINGVFDFKKLDRNTRKAVRQLDRVIDLNFYPVETARLSNLKWRPIGLGIMGLQDVFFQLGLPFDSPAALELSTRISEEIYFSALSASADLAEQCGPFPAFGETHVADGKLQMDLWGKEYDIKKWEPILRQIRNTGLRNSLLIAIAPTATIASIAGCYECIEPQTSNLFKRETLSGEFIQINKYLVADLKKAGQWTEELRNQLKLAEGSVQNLAIPAEMKNLYRTSWELSQRSLIDLAAARGPFIDQSQSLNFFVESPNIGKLSSMYMYAWESGLKTTYYLRSRGATRIKKTTVVETEPPAYAQPVWVGVEAQQGMVCSLENPEACESCQ